MTKNTKSQTVLRRKKIARGEAKVKRYIDALGAAMGKYESENPHWQTQGILWLLESGILSLRHYIESPKEKEIRWGNPFVELHYPVNWNWNAILDSEDPRIIYGKLSSSDTKAKTVKAMTRIMVETIIQTTLQTCTNGVALEKRGTGYRRLLPVEIIEKLKLIRSRKKRDLILEELYRPFSIGAAGIELDVSQMKDGAKLSRKSQRELIEAHKRIDLPAFTLSAAVDGHPLDLRLILQAHPLVVDAREKRAYYPITVGFHLAPKAEAGQDVLALMEQPWADPAQWSSEDQRDFWTHLIAAIRKLSEGLKPANPSPVQEAVLTISAKLKVSLDASNSGAIDSSITRLLEQFQQTGELVEMRHSWGPALSAPDFPSLLSRVRVASESVEKGRTLETLISALFTSVPGFTVKNNQRTATEEIDLVVINGSDEARWRNSGPMILVECKNWSTTCGKNEIVQFRDKMENRHGQCGLGVLVSWQGFAETVTRDMLRNSKGGSLIVLIDGKRLEQACASGRFLPTLCEAWDETVLI